MAFSNNNMYSWDNTVLAETIRTYVDVQIHDYIYVLQTMFSNSAPMKFKHAICAALSFQPRSQMSPYEPL